MLFSREFLCFRANKKLYPTTQCLRQNSGWKYPLRLCRHSYLKELLDFKILSELQLVFLYPLENNLWFYINFHLQRDMKWYLYCVVQQHFGLPYSSVFLTRWPSSDKRMRADMSKVLCRQKKKKKNVELKM